MKLKNIAALLLFLFAFSFAGISQVEDEDVPMFTGTRSIGSASIHDFKQIKGTPATYTIELENKGTTDMKVGNIKLPVGVSVTLLKEIMKPGEKGGLLVTIDPKLMKEGEFNLQLVITTNSESKDGVRISKTAGYGLKGQILK